MHHLLVHRRAQRRRIAAVALERRLGARRPAPATPPWRRGRPSSRPAPPSPPAPPAHRRPARWPRASARSPPATCRRSQSRSSRRHRRRDRRCRWPPSPRRAPGCRRSTGTSDAPRSTRRAAWSDADRPSAAPARSPPRRRSASTSAPPHFRQACRVSDGRVGAALAADPARRQPLHQHVLRHDDVEHDQRARAPPSVRRAPSPGPPSAGTRRARSPTGHPSQLSRSRTMPITASSLTRLPESIACLRRAAERRPGLHRLAQDVAGRDLRHPVLRRQPLRLRALARSRRAEHDDVQRRLHCGRHRHSETPSASNPRLLHEPIVVPHDELRLDLLHRVHRHADDDQQRRAAEEELHVQALR